jgi:hypothetical protein
MASSGIVGGPSINPRIRELLGGWAERNRVQFVWDPDRTITYTGSRGAWHISTMPINERDDWISVHPSGHDLVELQLVADAGHVEVLRLDLEALSKQLETALDWFQGWTDFFACGPGRGH